MARKRNQPSKVDLLPPDLREAVEKLWGTGRYTLEQLAGFLADLASGKRTMLPPELDLAVAVAPDAVPSKSSLGRHVKGLDAIAEKMQRSRMIADALMDRAGQGPESRTAALNIELLHAAILDIQTAAEEQGFDGEPGQPVLLDPAAVKALAAATRDLAQARKTDAELTLRLRAEIAKEMAAKADKALREAERGAAAAGGMVDFATLRAAVVGAYGDA